MDREDISRGEASSVFLHNHKREELGVMPPSLAGKECALPSWGPGWQSCECIWNLGGWKCRVISSERKNMSSGFSR